MSAECDITPESAGKIAGLVTFGSPLDKVTFLYQKRLSDENTSDEKFVQRQILNHRHGFKSRVLPREPVYIENTIKYLDNMKWLNFWHPNDKLGGPLDVYDVENIRREIDSPPRKAHDCYWTYPDMYKKSQMCSSHSSILTTFVTYAHEMDISMVKNSR